MKASYAITLGDWSVRSGDDPRTELLRLEVVRSLGARGDRVIVDLFAPGAPAPSLLEQAAGAALGAVGVSLPGAAEGASVKIRGAVVAHGDAMVVELAAGARKAKVATATIDSIETTLETVRIGGSTGAARLASRRAVHSFENRAAGQIAADLCRAAGVSKGTVGGGQRYPFLAVDGRQSLLDELRALARREGLELYFDADDRLTMTAFDKTRPDHVLRYGAELLSLSVDATVPPAASAVVVGEGPASERGGKAWHWIAKDPAVCRGEAGEGAQRIATDAVLRTKDAADLRARAAVGAWLDGGKRGRARLLGNPSIHPADAVEISGAPRDELNGLYKVAAVRHLFGRQTGFTTTLEITGHGGMPKDGGLLGALAGAIGL